MEYLKDFTAARLKDPLLNKIFLSINNQFSKLASTINERDIIARSPWVDVRSFLSSSNPIQASIDHMATPGVVLMPPGILEIGSSLTFGTGEYILQGSGRYRTQIKAKAGFASPFISLDNDNYLTFRDFQIYGNGGAGNHGISMTTTGRSIFQNILIDTCDTGIVMNGDNYFDDFYHIRIQNCAGHGLYIVDTTGPNNQNGFWGLELSNCTLQSLLMFGLATSNVFSRLNIDTVGNIALMLYENASNHAADSNIFSGVYIEGGDHDSIVLRQDACGNQFHLGAIGSNAGVDTVALYHSAINNEFHFGQVDDTAKNAGKYHIRDASSNGNRFFGVNPSWNLLFNTKDQITYKENLPIGSATWNPGSIADGDEEAKDVTVTGAALGDFAIASFSLDVADLVLNAQVTGANTVTCILANNTGAVVDLGEGTLYVKVIKK